MDKQTLRQYRYLVKEIEQLSEAQERLAAGQLGAVNINDMPKGNSIIHDRMAETACKMIELQYIIAERLNKAVAMQIEIERALDSLEPSERELMRYRYVDGLNWNRVTEKLYSDKEDFIDRFESYQRTVYRQHGRVLGKLRRTT
jgi:hypothetical protein